MDIHSCYSVYDKQDVNVKDEIDSEAAIKMECLHSQFQNDSELTDDCDRIKIEQVKLENVDIFDLTEDSVSCVKEELMVEKSALKIEPRQDTEDYDSDATTDSDVILERMINEHVKMENQIKRGATKKINEAMKTEGNDEEVKVKMETVDIDMSVNSDGYEDTDIQQLTEEFRIKDEDDASTAEVPGSASNKNVLEERRHLSKTLSSADAGELNRHEVVNSRSNEKSLNDLNVAWGAYSDCTTLDYMEVNAEGNNEHFFSSYDSTKRLENDIARESLGSLNVYVCTRCHVICKRQISLDEHIIENHPDLIASITRKIHECLDCSYKTVYSARLTTHLLKHRGTSSKYKSKSCMYCYATFATKFSLDDHIIKKHPNFTASVSSKIHECITCTYKTTNKSNLDKHMLLHPENFYSFKFSSCVHCNATFQSNRSLGEHILRKHSNAIASAKIHECTNCAYKTTMKTRFYDHILRLHPGSIATVPFKVHECAHCSYKTTAKHNLARHMQTHTESVSSHKLNTCTTRNEHPNFIQSISYKIHVCTNCTYKTTIKKLFDHHMLTQHPDLIATVSSTKHECKNCTYNTIEKELLDDHILTQHPDLIATVSSTKHECKNCTYNTIEKELLDDHLLRQHPDSVATASLTKYECKNCTYNTIEKELLDDHLLRQHPDSVATVSSKTKATTVKSRFVSHMQTNTESACSYKSGTCIHCGAKFQTEGGLNNHILSKHPDLVSSIESEIHECAKCKYKTTNKRLFDNHLLRKHSDANVSSEIHKCSNCTYKTAFGKCLVRHMQKHPETSSSSKLIKCLHCSATFEAKKSINNHILKKHPDFISTISSKIHECANCTYKTTFKGSFNQHILKNHPDAVANVSMKIHECANCTYKTTCKAKFDMHILRKHPELIDYSQKYECTHCTYKTGIKARFDEHMVKKHPDSIADPCLKIYECTNCTYKTTGKRQFDNHILRKHPDLIATTSTEIKECRYCTFKTTLTRSFVRHMETHPESASGKPCTCIHCSAIFRTKETLDNHILSKHPDCMSSITSKILECAKCWYKTTRKRLFDNHLLKKHPDSDSNVSFSSSSLG